MDGTAAQWRQADTSDLTRRDHELNERLKPCKAAWEQDKNGLAVAEAISWCWLYHSPIPDWIEQATIGLIVALRTPRERERHRDAMLDHARWEAVKSARMRGREDWWRTAKGDRRRGALSWAQAYEKASKDLKDMAARGEPATIKNSYQRVARALRAGRSGKYFIPKDRRYRDLG